MNYPGGDSLGAFNKRFFYYLYCEVKPSLERASLFLSLFYRSFIHCKNSLAFALLTVI